MGSIEGFIARYRREYGYYDQPARLVAQALDSNLSPRPIFSRDCAFRYPALKSSGR